MELEVVIGLQVSKLLPAAISCSDCSRWLLGQTTSGVEERLSIVFPAVCGDGTLWHFECLPSVALCYETAEETLPYRQHMQYNSPVLWNTPAYQHRISCPINSHDRRCPVAAKDLPPFRRPSVRSALPD